LPYPLITREISMERKRKVIFICSRNAARSQMAEGFLRALNGDTCEATSAGLRSFRVSRTAIRVMKEAGIDISAHRSKPVSEYEGTHFDLVVSLCGEAACIPRSLLPPGDEYLHTEFPDPENFRGDEEEILEAYRDVRDRIASWITEQFGPGGSRGKTDPSSPTATPDLQKT
jgi:arsenate reductase